MGALATDDINPPRSRAEAIARQREVSARLNAGRAQPATRGPQPAPPLPTKARSHHCGDAYAEIGRLFVGLVGACLQQAGEDGLSPKAIAEAIANFAPAQGEERPVTVPLIIEVVARQFKLMPHDITSQRRGALVRPRHVSMTLAKRLTRLNMSAIGAAHGGRDHSTVTQAVTKIEAIALTDGAMRALLDSLAHQIKSEA